MRTGGSPGAGLAPATRRFTGYPGHVDICYSLGNHLVLWVIITVTYSLATAVRTELVEVRTFEVRQAHHERVRKRHRICARQHLGAPRRSIRPCGTSGVPHRDFSPPKRKQGTKGDGNGGGITHSLRPCKYASSNACASRARLPNCTPVWNKRALPPCSPTARSTTLDQMMMQLAVRMAPLRGKRR